MAYQLKLLRKMTQRVSRTTVRKRQLKHDMRYEHAKTFPSKVKADENRWPIRASQLTIARSKQDQTRALH